MHSLLDAAAKEIDELDVDISRLAGLRSRYNRYGFEVAGQRYIFTITGKNRLRKFPDFKDDIIFEKITARFVYALMSVMRIVRKPIKSRL